MFFAAKSLKAPLQNGYSILRKTSLSEKKLADVCVGFLQPKQDKEIVGDQKLKKIWDLKEKADREALKTLINNNYFESQGKYLKNGKIKRCNLKYEN